MRPPLAKPIESKPTVATPAESRPPEKPKRAPQKYLRPSEAAGRELLRRPASKALPRKLTKKERKGLKLQEKKQKGSAGS